MTETEIGSFTIDHDCSLQAPRNIRTERSLHEVFERHRLCHSISIHTANAPPYQVHEKGFSKDRNTPKDLIYVNHASGNKNHQGLFSFFPKTEFNFLYFLQTLCLPKCTTSATGCFAPSSSGHSYEPCTASVQGTTPEILTFP